MAAGAPVSIAPERPRAAPATGVPLVAGGRIPLAFIVSGLAAFAAAALWMAVEPRLVLTPYLHPRFVALVHLWLPGFCLSVAIGAVYQLMPVVLGVPLRVRTKALWLHLGLHVAGVTMLVGGFAAGKFLWVAAGGGCVGAGSIVLLASVFRTFAHSTRRDPPAWSFPLAAAWLGATIFLGIVLALNRRWFFLPLGTIDLLRAHAHLGLAGFFLTLLQGTTFQLVPMFTMGDLRRPRLVWAGLISTQAGLLVLAPGLAWHAGAPIAGGAALIVAGIVFSGTALISTFRTRRRRTLEPGLRAFAVGAGALAFAGFAGLALVVLQNQPFSLRAISAYGLIVVAGGLSLTILGMLCKIVPFLVWMRVYGPRVGRQPVPLATALASPSLQRVWLWLHGGALGMLCTACLLDSLALATAGTWALVAAAIVYLNGTGRVVRHLFRPATAAKPNP